MFSCPFDWVIQQVLGLYDEHDGTLSTIEGTVAHSIIHRICEKASTGGKDVPPGDFCKVFKTQYDEKDSIGKRYRRQDAIGTPFCVTVDHDTLQDNCVTVRYRDTMKQDRIPVDELHAMIAAATDMKVLYRKLLN